MADRTDDLKVSAIIATRKRKITEAGTNGLAVAATEIADELTLLRQQTERVARALEALKAPK